MASCGPVGSKEKDKEDKELKYIGSRATPKSAIELLIEKYGGVAGKAIKRGELQKRKAGSSGLELSVLSLGTW